jgi:hypothetical protein
MPWTDTRMIVSAVRSVNLVRDHAPIDEMNSRAHRSVSGAASKAVRMRAFSPAGTAPSSPSS